MSASGIEARESIGALATATATASRPRALPFLEGAPSPLIIMAIGILVVVITFSRRFRSGRTGA